METYIFIVLLFIAFAFIVKVLYFEREQLLNSDHSKKPLPITVPADPKYRKAE